MLSKEALLKDLRGNNYRKRQAAATSLGNSRDSSNLPEVLSCLSSEKNPEVKAALIMATGQLGGPPEIDVVSTFLKSDNIRLRGAAAVALSNLKDPDIFSKVAPLLTDSDNHIISVAVKILWKACPEKLLAAVKKLLSSNDKEERKCAVWALSELQYSVSRPLLDNARYDQSITVRLTANDILARLENNLAISREADARKSAEARAEQAEEAQVQQKAQQQPKVSPPQQKALSQEHPAQAATPQHHSATPQAVRDPSSQAPLAGHQPAQPSQLPATQQVQQQPALQRQALPQQAHPVQQTQQEARQARHTQQIQQTQQTLQAQQTQQTQQASQPPRAPHSERPSPASAAQAAPKQEEGGSELLELLSDSDPVVRVKVIKIFESSRNREIVPHLVRLLEIEKNGHVIATAVKALGFLGGEKSLPVVAPFLKSQDARIVANCIEGLGWQRTPQVLELVRPFMTDRRPRVKANALVVAAEYDEKGALAATHDLLRSPRDNDRRLAVQILSGIASPQAVDALTSIYFSGDDLIRPLAAEALNAITKAARIAKKFGPTPSDREKAKQLEERSKALDERLLSQDRKARELEEKSRLLEESVRALTAERDVLQGRIDALEAEPKKRAESSRTLSTRQEASPASESSSQHKIETQARAEVQPQQEGQSRAEHRIHIPDDAPSRNLFKAFAAVVAIQFAIIGWLWLASSERAKRESELQASLIKNEDSLIKAREQYLDSDRRAREAENRLKKAMENNGLSESRDSSGNQDGEGSRGTVDLSRENGGTYPAGPGNGGAADDPLPKTGGQGDDGATAPADGSSSVGEGTPSSQEGSSDGQGDDSSADASAVAGSEQGGEGGADDGPAASSGAKGQPPLASETVVALEKLGKAISDSEAKGSPQECLSTLKVKSDELQEYFYMGELYLFEKYVTAGEAAKAVEELKRVRKMVSSGYILWDIQKGEWISPKED